MCALFSIGGAITRRELEGNQSPPGLATWATRPGKSWPLGLIKGGKAVSCCERLRSMNTPKPPGGTAAIEMTPKKALTFVKTKGVVLESGRGAAASLAEAIAGGPIRGSWWGHPKGNDIFLCSRAIRQSPDVLVCRLVGGKVTYVHRRLWPALVRLAGEFNPVRLAAIQEVHTSAGKHKINTTPFPDWVPKVVMRAAKRLTRDDAARLLQFAFSAKPNGKK